MANNSDKRKRSVNWDEKEKRLLVDLVKDNISIVENVRPDTDSNLKKKMTWQIIENQFILSGFSRDATRIKEQWRRLKATAKRNIQYYRKQLELCGANAANIQSPSAIDYEIYELIPHEFLEDGNESDHDNTPNNSNKKTKINQESSISDESSNSSWPLFESNAVSITRGTPKNSNKATSKAQHSDINSLQNHCEEQENVSSLTADNIKVEPVEIETDVEAVYTDDPINSVDDDDVQLDAIDEEHDETQNEMHSLPPNELYNHMKLPPLHRIVQEPINRHTRLLSENIYYSVKNNEFNSDNNAMMSRIPSIMKASEHQIELYNLKKQLLQMNIERLEMQKQFDIELHEYRMKIEREISEKRCKHEDELNSLKIAMEKRMYEKRLECLTIDLI